MLRGIGTALQVKLSLYPRPQQTQRLGFTAVLQQSHCQRFVEAMRRPAHWHVTAVVPYEQSRPPMAVGCEVVFTIGRSIRGLVSAPYL